MVGGSRPLLRSFDSGKVTRGIGGVVMPMKLMRASMATPSFSSVSVVSVAAVSSQAGIQPGKSSRRQVV
ncbi:hypothetical protein D9M69_594600 [compost metagenome]